MATQKQAKKAYEEYFNSLQKAGAHSLAIDIKKGTKKSYAIIAFVEGNTGKIPSSVEIIEQGKTTNVPVIIEQSGKFKPQ